MYRQYSKFCNSEHTKRILDGKVINPGSYDGFRNTISMLHQLGLLKRINEEDIPIDMLIPGRGAAFTGQKRHYYMLANNEPDIPFNQLPLDWKNPLKALGQKRNWVSMRE